MAGRKKAGPVRDCNSVKKFKFKSGKYKKSKQEERPAEEKERRNQCPAFLGYKPRPTLK
jgi:hypothetical protein